MIQFYEKHADWLIPVLSLVVIFQTVMLVGVGPKAVASSLKKNNPLVAKPTPTPVQPGAELVFIPASVSAKKGESVNVEIWLKPNKNFNLNGMDLALSFDPKQLGVTKITTEKVFSIVNQNRQSEKVGRVFVTYLDDEGTGVAFSQPVKLLNLTVSAKQEGAARLGLLTQPTGGTTVLTEKQTSQKIPFTSEDLIINVVK